MDPDQQTCSFCPRPSGGGGIGVIFKDGTGAFVTFCGECAPCHPDIAAFCHPDVLDDFVKKMEEAKAQPYVDPLQRMLEQLEALSALAREPSCDADHREEDQRRS